MQTSIAVGAVFLFVSLVGYDASIVRSALMGSIVVCAKLLHRQASGVHTLLLVASIMLISNPLSIFDAGFHLSFVATYALLIMPEIKKIPEYTMTTVWVSVFVCPYILYLSGALSMIGIGINIAVLFCIPFFMLVASASLVLSALHIFVGIDVVILEVISRYIFSMTKIAALFPPAQYQISPSVTMVIYVLLFSCVSFFSNRYTTAEFIEKHYQKFSLQNSN
jgi:competence protein ComEC